MAGRRDRLPLAAIYLLVLAAGRPSSFCIACSMGGRRWSDDDGARFTASPRGQDVCRRNRILLSSIILLLSSISFLAGTSLKLNCSRQTDELDKIYSIRLSIVHPYNHTARPRPPQPASQNSPARFGGNLSQITHTTHHTHTTTNNHTYK